MANGTPEPGSLGDLPSPVPNGDAPRRREEPPAEVQPAAAQEPEPHPTTAAVPAAAGAGAVEAGSSEEASTGWECPACTLWNEESRHVCGACEASRPGSMDRGERNFGVSLRYDPETHESPERFLDMISAECVCTGRLAAILGEGAPGLSHPESYCFQERGWRDESHLYEVFKATCERSQQGLVAQRITEAEALSIKERCATYEPFFSTEAVIHGEGYHPWPADTPTAEPPTSAPTRPQPAASTAPADNSSMDQIIARLADASASLVSMPDSAAEALMDELTRLIGGALLEATFSVDADPGGPPDYFVLAKTEGSPGNGGVDPVGRSVGCTFESTKGMDGPLALRLIQTSIRLALILPDHISDHPEQYTFEERGWTVGSLDAAYENYRRGRREQGEGCVLYKAPRRDAEVVAARLRQAGMQARVVGGDVGEVPERVSRGKELTPLEEIMLETKHLWHFLEQRERTEGQTGIYSSIVNEVGERDAFRRFVEHLQGRGMGPFKVSPPANPAVVASLPRFQYSAAATEDGDNADDMCNVCLCPFEEGEAGVRMGSYCHHVFHADCVLPWLDRHNTCPVCRAALPSVPIFSVDIQRNRYYTSRLADMVDGVPTSASQAAAGIAQWPSTTAATATVASSESTRAHTTETVASGPPTLSAGGSTTAEDTQATTGPGAAGAAGTRAGDSTAAASSVMDPSLPVMPATLDRDDHSVSPLPLPNVAERVEVPAAIAGQERDGSWWDDPLLWNRPEMWLEHVERALEEDTDPEQLDATCEGTPVDSLWESLLDLPWEAGKIHQWAESSVPRTLQSRWLAVPGKLTGFVHAIATALHWTRERDPRATGVLRFVWAYLVPELEGRGWCIAPVVANWENDVLVHNRTVDGRAILAEVQIHARKERGISDVESGMLARWILELLLCQMTPEVASHGEAELRKFGWDPDNVDHWHPDLHSIVMEGAETWFNEAQEQQHRDPDWFRASRRVVTETSLPEFSAQPWGWWDMAPQLLSEDPSNIEAVKAAVLVQRMRQTMVDRRPQPSCESDILGEMRRLVPHEEFVFEHDPSCQFPGDPVRILQRLDSTLAALSAMVRHQDVLLRRLPSVTEAAHRILERCGLVQPEAYLEMLHQSFMAGCMTAEVAQSAGRESRLAWTIRVRLHALAARNDLTAHMMDWIGVPVTHFVTRWDMPVRMIARCIAFQPSQGRSPEDGWERAVPWMGILRTIGAVDVRSIVYKLWRGERRIPYLREGESAPAQTLARQLHEAVVRQEHCPRLVSAWRDLYLELDDEKFGKAIALLQRVVRSAAESPGAIKMRRLKAESAKLRQTLLEAQHGATMLEVLRFAHVRIESREKTRFVMSAKDARELGYALLYLRTTGIWDRGERLLPLAQLSVTTMR